MGLTEKLALPWSLVGECWVDNSRGKAILPRAKPAVAAVNLLGQAEREGWVEKLKLAAGNLIGGGNDKGDDVAEVANAIEAAIREAGGEW